jgi:hypothetical protein
MDHLQARSLVRTPEDEATIKRWRLAVCVFYGVISLVLVAACGLLQFVNRVYSHDAQIAGSPRPTSASAVPGGVRH